MRRLSERTAKFAFALILVATGLVAAAFAQTQNPIQAAKDAYNKAKQQQRQPQTTAPPASPSSQPAQGGSAPITADDLEKPAPAANVALDPTVLPDIVGVHLGMPLRTAAAALQMAYPTVKITPYSLRMPTITQPVANSVSTFSNNAFEVVTVGVVLPPNQQIVWAVTRWINTPPGGTPMNRPELLANLRKKYGKETYSNMGGMGGKMARNDVEISDMFWLYDESGKRIPQPSPTFGVTGGFSGCLAPVTPREGNMRPPGISGTETPALQSQSAWCKSSCVAVHVQITPNGRDAVNFVDQFSMDMVDLPLAIRAEKATVDFYQNIGQKQHQEEIDRSKSVQPRF
jgi:hypothetical protein